MAPIDPVSLITPRRKIQGISAILLPLLADDSVDWKAFDDHVERTLAAGLAPAVNMDTGYGHLIDEPTRAEVLNRTHPDSPQRPESDLPVLNNVLQDLEKWMKV